LACSLLISAGLLPSIRELKGFCVAAVSSCEEDCPDWELVDDDDIY
jgi:hypothetical protein